MLKYGITDERDTEETKVKGKRVINLALPDSPVITGTSQEVFDYYGLNAAGIVNTVKKALEG